MKFKFLIAISIILIPAIILSCNKKKIPTAPPAPGRVVLENASGITIIIQEYVHQRGEVEASRKTNAHLFSGGSYNFVNLIDGNNSMIFDGGDKLKVSYKSKGGDSPFYGSWSIEVNGNVRGKLNQNGGIGG